MPNWCYNKLEIEGDSSDLKELNEMMKEGFSLEKIMPTPKEYLSEGKEDSGEQLSFAEGMERRGGLPNWYKWRAVNWGTKWDVTDHKDDNIKLEKTETGYKTEFYTAWSPPVFALKALSRRLKSLTTVIKYVDEQMNFEGKATIRNGTIDETHAERTMDGFQDAVMGKSPKLIELKDNDK
jgi:hypothetical protein